MRRNTLCDAPLVIGTGILTFLVLGLLIQADRNDKKMDAISNCIYQEARADNAKLSDREKWNTYYPHCKLKTEYGR